MKIVTLGSRIQLKVDEPKIGVLMTESMPTAIECAEVIGIGEKVTLPLKKGDKIIYKSWSVDICSIENKKYYFIDETTKGICAIIEK